MKADGIVMPFKHQLTDMAGMHVSEHDLSRFYCVRCTMAVRL